jgi:hypothetical protein
MGLTVLLQQRAVRGVEPDTSLMAAIGQGYFFSTMPLGSNLSFRKAQGTDIGIVTNELTRQQLDALEREIGLGNSATKYEKPAPADPGPIAPSPRRFSHASQAFWTAGGRAFSA